MIGSVPVNIAAYCAAALVSLLITPRVIRLALAKNLVDRPGTRKMHFTPIPRIGGTVIALAMFCGAVPMLFLLPNSAMPNEGWHHQVIALLCLSLTMCLVGFIDDLYGLRARVKLVAQLAAAVAACSFGIRIDVLGLVDNNVLELRWLTWPITILWIVGVTNAVNLIDGLDGLAAGIAAITCAAVAIFSVYTDQIVMGMLMLAMLGSLTGFLFYNFNPARVFMGDSGTLFLGFFLGCSSVICSSKAHTIVGIALPLLSLGLPVFDTVLSIIRRLLERRSPFSPDRGHIHHRLIALGLNHKTVVLLMYLVTLAAAGLGTVMMVLRNRGAVAVFLATSLALVLVFRIAGAIRFRELYGKLHRNLSLARHTASRQHEFERLNLRLSEAKLPRDQWRCLRLAAREFDLVRLRLSLPPEAGIDRELAWSAAEGNGGLAKLSLRVRLRGKDPEIDRPVDLEIDVAVRGSVETAISSASLFCRLAEEHALGRILYRSRIALPISTAPTSA